MLYRILLVLVLFFLSCQSDQSQVDRLSKAGGETHAVVGYDSVKAQKYGADDYGMKKYVMAFLKRGPNRELDSLKAAELQNAHLKNIIRLADEGKLVLAGPFLDDGDLRGIYVFNVGSIAEAEELTRSDPAIQAGSLVMELKEWYCSAALIEINEIHKTLEKHSVVQSSE